MARLRPGPRPLDRFVWVQKTVDGQVRQMRVARSQLPSLSPNWERIADPTKKATAIEGEHGPELVDLPEGTKAVKKTAKKQPSTAAEPAPEKE